MKTINEIVSELRALGHEVKTYQRMDTQGRKRGVIIRSIDGVYYTGSKGNEVARNLVGATLSQYQQETLEKLNKKPSKLAPSKRRLDPIDEEVKRRLRRIQREYRKRGREYGIPTLKKYRYHLKMEGKEKADRLLSQAEKYVKGIAYEENIEAFIKRLQLANDKLGGKLTEIIDMIKDKDKETFKEETLEKLMESYYTDLVNNPNQDTAVDTFITNAKEILLES